MRARCTLSAAEIEPLYAEIDARLGRVGIETQPEVASKILRLTSDPLSGLRQYADVVKSDAALTGRLLRLANSAFFAQLKPVTTLERACVLLGLERLKSVSLGFYLSRAAVGDPRNVLVRRVWGESVFRACLASEVARACCPALATEAFTVGLMLDAGAPLLARLVGPPAEAILNSGEFPARQFQVEYDRLPFTHVDVGATLSRRWALPEVLARPIEWHHTPPGDTVRTEPVHQLHRVAYYVGALGISAGERADTPRPMLNLGESVLAMRQEALRPIIRRAADEYTALREVFKDVADSVGEVTAIAEQAHEQLVASMDRVLAAELRLESAAPRRVSVAGHVIEIEPGPGGRAVAYVRDARGERVVSHAFDVRTVSPEAIADALGVEDSRPDELAALGEQLRMLAA